MLKTHSAILLVLLTLFSRQHAYAKPQFLALEEFGENPGQISASYLNQDKKIDTFVVLLHGCVQNAQELATRSGFVSLAKANNVGLLLPQQSDKNNIKRCFNWFSPGDTDKDSGETQSIVNMINSYKKQTKAQYVYIAGLSAGGAMTTNLLINYPRLFSGGGVIAGIPYPCADNLIKAISCMRSGPSMPAKKLARQIKAIKQPWPPISIWTGLNDTVVNPLNSLYLARQWQIMNHLEPTEKLAVHQGYRITQWQDQQGNAQIQLVEIENLDHGIAINSAQPHGGRAAPFVLESPLSSAIELFKFWKITNKTNQLQK